MCNDGAIWQLVHAAAPCPQVSYSHTAAEYRALSIPQANQTNTQTNKTITVSKQNTAAPEAAATTSTDGRKWQQGGVA